MTLTLSKMGGKEKFCLYIVLLYEQDHGGFMGDCQEEEDALCARSTTKIGASESLPMVYSNHLPKNSVGQAQAM